MIDRDDLVAEATDYVWPPLGVGYLGEHLTPEQEKQLTQGVPDHLYSERCPGTCCGGGGGLR